jgi:membrane-associated phospholipid phosphatase
MTYRYFDTPQGGLASFAAFLLVMAVDEPTMADLTLYDFSRRLYDRRLEVLQWPLEIVGLPGAYIPIGHALAHWARRRGARDSSAIIAAAWSGWVAVRAMRLVIHRPRPPRPPGRGPKRESTFPSGHTVGLTTLALVAADVLERGGLLTPREMRAAAIGVPLLIGATRIYVREHWLTDVIGGWTLGAAVAAGCLYAVRRRPNRQPRRTASRST